MFFGSVNVLQWLEFSSAPVNQDRSIPDDILRLLGSILPKVTFGVIKTFPG